MRNLYTLFKIMKKYNYFFENYIFFFTIEHSLMNSVIVELGALMKQLYVIYDRTEIDYTPSLSARSTL